MPTKPIRACAVCARLSLARAALVVGTCLSFVAPLESQTAIIPADNLDSLVARALVVSPQLRAAKSRVDAARARVGPAGARPDPMLTAGVENLPLGSERSVVGETGTIVGGPDPMTMRVLGVSQTIPYPGKLALRERSARLGIDVSAASVTAVRSDIIRRVRDAYFELAYVDRALSIIEKRRALFSDIARVTEARYEAGATTQQDVLASRAEATRIVDDANGLVEQRRAQLAALNALLDRPSDTPLGPATIPARIARAAVADSAGAIRFNSDSVGARVANSPIPTVDALQSLAAATSPMLREHEARIAVQAAEVAVAEKEKLPDFDLALAYGQRSGRPDMITATVSIPLPVQKSRKYGNDVAQARGELTALEDEHHAQLNELNADIARVHSELERDRTQLALYVRAILPQGNAAMAASMAEYGSNRGELRSVLENQGRLLDYELTYNRTLVDFAKQMAELEQLVGQEVLR